VAEALLEGASFSAALARQPEAFPALYVATIKAAEKTGDLGEALARYVTYQQQLDAIRRKVASASVYPMLLLAVGVLVAVFLLAYVVPRFAAVYQDLGRELPWITQLMLGWGRFLDEHAALAALAALAAGAGAGYALSRPSVRAALLRQIWRIPRLGERLRIYDLSRLYRTLAMLLRSGMPIVAAMRNASGLLRPEPRARLALALADIEQGRPISQAMAERGLTTPVALRMLRVGERSGRMSELMERIAAYFEDDLGRWVEWFTRLFEPILMLLIGGVIGAVVLLLYMPILELAGALQ
jgi:general secretion pathway protein F